MSVPADGPAGTSITMPQLGESVTEGTVTRWLKNVGDSVAMDEPLLEVSTDKVDTEIPSPVAGVLLEIAAVEDDVVPVGGLLARVGQAVGQAGDSSDASQPPLTPSPPATAPPVAASAASAEAISPTTLTQTPPPAEPLFTEAPTEERPPAHPAPLGPPIADLINITLPALGESVTEGTVTRWLKRVGETVAVDEPIVEVSTDKVDTEIPSPVAGTLSQVMVGEDETVDVGAVLAVVATGMSSASSSATEAASDHEPAAAMPTAAQSFDSMARPAATAPLVRLPSAAAPAVRSSPLVRRAARESGVDLESVSGTGVGGRVTREDVAQAAGAAQTPEPKAAQSGVPVAAPPPLTTPTAGAQPQRASSPSGGAHERQEPLPRLRRLIAARMVESLRVSAQLTTVVEIDVTTIARLRTRVQSSFTAKEGVRLTFLPFFARATVEALRTHPLLNSSMSGDGTMVTHHGAQHLGIAVDTERGLLVPVVRDAGDLTLAALARRIADLAERTRSGRVTPDDLAGATFTLTNTGSRGALIDTPIISQPQVGILATGAVTKRPMIMAGQSGEDVIAIRPMAYFALTYDHRLVDGADAARFLTTVKTRLEQADFAAELGG